MAVCAVRSLENALTAFDQYTPELAESVRKDEDRCDHYEDVIGTYLVKLSAQKMGEKESAELLRLVELYGNAYCRLVKKYCKVSSDIASVSENT